MFNIFNIRNRINIHPLATFEKDTHNMKLPMNTDF